MLPTRIPRKPCKQRVVYNFILKIRMVAFISRKRGRLFGTMAYPLP